jgi:hypothetical protein
MERAIGRQGNVFATLDTSQATAPRKSVQGKMLCAMRSSASVVQQGHGPNAIMGQASASVKVEWHWPSFSFRHSVQKENAQGHVMRKHLSATAQVTETAITTLGTASVLKDTKETIVVSTLLFKIQP